MIKIWIWLLLKNNNVKTSVILQSYKVMTLQNRFKEKKVKKKNIPQTRFREIKRQTEWCYEPLCFILRAGSSCVWFHAACILSSLLFLLCFMFYRVFLLRTESASWGKYYGWPETVYHWNAPHTFQSVWSLTWTSCSVCTSVNVSFALYYYSPGHQRTVASGRDAFNVRLE